MTVIPLSDADLVAAWECGLGESPAARARDLLACAIPDEGRPGLGAWTAGQQSDALLELHAATFGELVEAHTPCPACGDELEVAFAVSEVLEGPRQPSKSLHIDAGGGAVAELRPATVDDLVAAAAAPSSSAARRLLLERVVLHAELNGEPVSPSLLPNDAVPRIGGHLAAADPGAEVVLTLTCPVCLVGTRVVFDIFDFLWREVDAHARDLLEQVTALAGAFGWTESEILRLSRARRRLYLELAGVA